MFVTLCGKSFNTDNIEFIELDYRFTTQITVVLKGPGVQHRIASRNEVTLFVPKGVTQEECIQTCESTLNKRLKWWDKEL